ncbi:MAG: filamentous hemagglutinin N-terminal domain-containing protein [Ramlibacter sp.]|nr:filamentous hemagglutinin N-terminal domain-containing protein [Ramlibacter sp.]
MNTTNTSSTVSENTDSLKKSRTMTKQQQAEQKSFTVRTGGRKLTYVFRPRKRFSSLLKFLLAIFGGQVVLWPGMATAQGLSPNALPTGGSVAAGQAGINSVGNAMTVNQQSSKVIINWSTYNIGADASVTYNQPSASSVALNQVTGADPSQILGRLSANGQVWLVNSAGVYFGQNATIDVGGMLASTLKVDNNQFMNSDKVTFENDGTAGSIKNDGNITARNGGYVALIAPNVQNAGVINANMGTVRLAAGDKVTVDLAGDGLIKLNIDKASAEAVVANAGRISANGGTVVLSARSAGDLASLVVNNTGIIEAKSLVERNGRIFLDGGNGTVENSGSLIATGDAAGTKGGAVQMAGTRVGVVGAGSVDVSGDAGGGTALIGGNWQGNNTASIIDGSAVANAQQVAVASGASIKADARTSGNGGTVVAWADGHTQFNGAVSARGGATGGNGGQVETSGKKTLGINAGARVDVSASKGKAGSWLLDPNDITIAAADANVSVAGTTYQDDGGATNATVDAAVIGGALTGGATVNVQTSNAGAAGNGDIFVTSAVTSAGDGTLNLIANRNITVSASIDAGATKTLNVSLYAGSNSTAASTATAGSNASTVTINSSIATGGGNLGIVTKGDVTGAGDLNLGAGSLAVDTKSTGQVNLTGVITAGAANLTATGKDISVANTANNFTGAVSATGFNVTIADTNALSLGTIVATGTLAATAGTADLTQVGSATVSGAATLTSNAGSVVADNTANNFASVTLASAGNATLYDSNAMTLSSLTVGAAGNVDVQAGKGGTGALTLGTGVSTTGDVTFVSGSGALTTGGAISGNNIQLTAGAAGLSIGHNVAAGGVLGLKATGNNIDQTAGVISAVGVTTMDAGTAGGIITVQKAGNNFQAKVNASAGTVRIADGTGGVILGNVNADSVTVGSTGGDVTNTGAITNYATTGNANVTVNAGTDTVTLNNGGNRLGTANLTGTTVSVTSIGGLDVGTVKANTFGATVSGANVTQSGAITKQDGSDGAAVTVDAGAKDIALTNTGNKLASVSLTGTTVAVTDGTAGISIGATKADSLTVDSTNGAVTNSAAIVNQVGTGAANVTVNAAGYDVTLGDVGNKLGTVSVAGVNVSVYDSDTSGTVLGTSTVTGTLGVTSKGHITQSGVLTVTGAASFTIDDTASQNINLSTQANDFKSTVTFAKTGTGTVNNVGLRNANSGALFGNITLPGTYNDLTVIFDKAAMILPALTVGGTLTATAGGGSITQTGALDIAGASSFTAYDAGGPTRYAITLDDNGNKFVGAISAKGGAFTLDNGTYATKFGTIDVSSVTLEGTGDLTLTNSITTTGAQTYGGNVILTSDVTLAGNGISVSGTMKSDGTNRALIINDAGATKITGSLGTTTAGERLASVDITSTGGTQLGGNVYTTGSQTYNSAVT